jgi:anti-anti-sigma factor
LPLDRISTDKAHYPVVDVAKDLSVRERDGVTIVRFNIEGLLGHEVDLLSARIRALIDEGARKLVLDFKHVRFAGSAVLGMLLSLSKAMSAAGGKVVLSHPEHITPLLKVTHAERLFTLAPDAKTAMALLQEPAST